MANSTADTPDVSETKLAKMRIKELREHARERGIAGADDLHKPELLLMVKDWHYSRAHGGEHRPDAPALARNGKKSSAPERSKADAPKAKAKAKAKKDDAKAERKKAEQKKAERAEAEKKKDSGKKKVDHGRDDAREAVATIRRRLAQIEDALAELESDLR